MSRIAFLLANAAYDALGRPPENDYVAQVVELVPLPRYYLGLVQMLSLPRDANTRTLFLAAYDLDADFVLGVAARSLLARSTLDGEARAQLEAVIGLIDWGTRDSEGQLLQFFS